MADDHTTSDVLALEGARLLQEPESAQQLFHILRTTTKLAVVQRVFQMIDVVGALPGEDASAWVCQLLRPLQGLLPCVFVDAAGVLVDFTHDIARVVSRAIKATPALVDSPWLPDVVRSVLGAVAETYAYEGACVRLADVEVYAHLLTLWTPAAGRAPRLTNATRTPLRVLMNTVDHAAKDPAIAEAQRHIVQALHALLQTYGATEVYEYCQRCSQRLLAWYPTAEACPDAVARDVRARLAPLDADEGFETEATLWRKQNRPQALAPLFESVTRALEEVQPAHLHRWWQPPAAAKVCQLLAAPPTMQLIRDAYLRDIEGLDYDAVGARFWAAVTAAPPLARAAVMPMLEAWLQAGGDKALGWLTASLPTLLQLVRVPAQLLQLPADHEETTARRAQCLTPVLDVVVALSRRVAETDGVLLHDMVMALLHEARVLAEEPSAPPGDHGHVMALCVLRAVTVIVQTAPQPPSKALTHDIVETLAAHLVQVARRTTATALAHDTHVVQVMTSLLTALQLHPCHAPLCLTVVKALVQRVCQRTEQLGARLVELDDQRQSLNWQHHAIIGALLHVLTRVGPAPVLAAIDGDAEALAALRLWYTQQATIRTELDDRRLMRCASLDSAYHRWAALKRINTMLDGRLLLPVAVSQELETPDDTPG